MSVETGSEETPERETSGFRRKTLSTSGFLTPILLTFLCGALLVAAFERGRGHYQRLRAHVVSGEQGAAAQTGPGGQPVLEIHRSPATNGSQPEFASATLLPGRGMSILQITAMVPGRGEVRLLFSPDLGSVSQVLTASGPDAYGAMSSSMGAAIAVPWAGQLSGVPTANRSILQGVWQGQRVTFPAAAEDSTLSTEGLLLNRGADSVETSSIPGGKAVQAVFHAGSFSGSWPSNLELNVQTELTAHDFELEIVAKNTGQAATPVGIGWHPYFALPANDRRHVLLSVPPSRRVPKDTDSGSLRIPLAAASTPALDFTSPRGTPLGEATVRETYTHLQRGVLADGPAAELRYPDQHYALRLTLLSDAIRNLRVAAPADRPWISITAATNLDNALRRDTPPEQGLNTLQPGDSLHWRIRLEIAPFP